MVHGLTLSLGYDIQARQGLPRGVGLTCSDGHPSSGACPLSGGWSPRGAAGAATEGQPALPARTQKGQGRHGYRATSVRSCQPQERPAAGRGATADSAEQSKTMAAPRRRSRRPGQPRRLDAGPLEPLIGSFALHLAAEGKAARAQGYTSAVRWLAAGYLAGEPGKTSWEQVDAQDIQRWMTQLLDRYSGAYASIQFRALRQFFKWRAGETSSTRGVSRSACPAATAPRYWDRLFLSQGLRLP